MQKWNGIQFLPVLSTGCQASCKYCFGPNSGKTIDPQNIDRLIEYIKFITTETGQEKIEITFHGGEPLLADIAIWKKVLSACTASFAPGKISFSMQSNLWNLNPELCKLFKEYNLSIGTSLDGTKEINDRQRGEGYFDRTFKNIQLAALNHLTPGVIATFTPFNAARYEEVFSFFLKHKLSFTVHACVPVINQGPGDYDLDPQTYGNLLCNLLELYIPARHYIRIPTLDQMILSFVEQEGQVCIFKDCLGMFLAICPDGYIYPCQRFSGHKEFALGNIKNKPTVEDLMASPVAQKMEQRQNNVKKLCANCEYYSFCKGGCLYNAWSAGNNIDPYCESYKQIFSKINDGLIQEISSTENVEAIISGTKNYLKNPLLRKGALIDLARKNVHPTKKVENALKIVSVVELAGNTSIGQTVFRLNGLGISVSEEYLENMKKSIGENRKPLNNLYIHLSYQCQLACTHCYAAANGDSGDFFPHQELEKLILSASDLQFRQVIFTGGEPLLHPDIDLILELLSKLKEKVKSVLFVLRSNFIKEMQDKELEKIANAFHKIIVSLDGNEETHDSRRGAGSFAAAAANIGKYQRLFANGKNWGELSLGCVLHSNEMESDAVLSMHEFAHRHHIRNIRFKPVLPIGRASEGQNEPVSEALSSFMDIGEILSNGYTPVNSCGMGDNLYVDPNGDAFPCYAFKKKHTYLGNVRIDGLEKTVKSVSFKDLSTHTVDTNPKCSRCRYRYLCGGACRAWGGEKTQIHLNTPPPNCEGLYQRAQEIYQFALNYLKDNGLINAESDVHSAL
jgi:uncharacterized protein